MKSAFAKNPLLTIAALAIALWLTGCAQVPKIEEIPATPTSSPAPQVQSEAPAEIKAVVPAKAPTAKPKAQVPFCSKENTLLVTIYY